MACCRCVRRTRFSRERSTFGDSSRNAFPIIWMTFLNRIRCLGNDYPLPENFLTRLHGAGRR